METSSSASVLWVRALFAGSFAFFLGVAGHLMAQGLLPGTAFLVVLLAFTVALAVPGARPAGLEAADARRCWSAGRRSSTSA